MSVYKIDIHSSMEQVEHFYSLYVESYKDLCLWKGKTIINLGEYVKPTLNKNEFIEDLNYVIKGLGIIIYYTHNDDVITSIAFVEIESLAKCYVKIKFLCGNEATRDEIRKETGESQGRHMLDFLFNIYRNSVILIEPATPSLIPYYTKYNKPSFPYDPNTLKETYGFLVFGNLSYLSEICFPTIFRSINMIKNMINILQFESINDLYKNTNSLTTLKDKLITKLDYLVKTKQMKPHYYEQILQKIIDIKFYDIEDILLFSKKFERNGLREKELVERPITGGKKRVKRNKRTKKQKKINGKSRKIRVYRA